MMSLKIYRLGWCLGSLILVATWNCVCHAQSSEPAAGRNLPVQGALDAASVGYEVEFPAMGTLVSFKAFHEDMLTVERAFELAEQRVHELEAILTDYDPRSETRQLSQLAFEQEVRVSEDLWQVLVASEGWYIASKGAFDASLGSVTRLWRKHRRTDRLPNAEQIMQALELSGWQHVHLDPNSNTLTLRREGIQFDFGAIGKGYIVDEAFKTLQERGLTACLVNISGNMRCGQAPPGKPGWRVAIAPVAVAGKPLQHVLLSNQSIATSGDLWQYVVVDGVRRSHILDPKTGYGVSGPQSATAIARSATDADALATAACILGFDDVSKLLAFSVGAELLMADLISGASPRIQASPGFPLE